MGFFLPALLQGFDSIHTQRGRSAQSLRFGNQGMATRKTCLLHHFQWFVRGVDGSLPNRLQLGKHFFAQVAAFAPALGKLVQLACNAFPIWAVGMLNCPCFDFFNQSQTLGFVRSSLGASFFKPYIHHFVGTVASRVKALPQRGVGRRFFVDFFPLLAQVAQGFLHLAATHGWHAGHVVGFGGSWLLSGGSVCGTCFNRIFSNWRDDLGCRCFNCSHFNHSRRIHNNCLRGFSSHLLDNSRLLRRRYFFCFRRFGLHGLGHRRRLEQGLGLHGQL